MSNDYYNRTYDFQAATIARSGQVDEELDGAVAGFAKLPSKARMDSGNTNYVTAGGTADAITVSMPTTLTTYTGKDGYQVTAKIASTNTGSVTLNVDGLGAKTVLRNNGDALVAGDLQANGFYKFIYNETTGNFRVSAYQGIVTDAAAQATAAAASATSSASSATSSAASATASASSATAAAASYDSFDDRYLGAKASDPALDNDGDALQDGAIYWNSTDGKFRVYNGTTTNWEDGIISSGLVVSQDGSTGAANIPSGTTAQAPTAGDGKTRFDTDTNEGVMGAGSAYFNIINDRAGAAGGTVDAITVTFARPLLAWANGIGFRVRATGANTSTTPTISPNGLTAKAIVKNGNQALASGDIYGADHEMLLIYNSTNDTVELLNPRFPGDSKRREASAWVNFDGTGTVAIRDSFNVSSITDNGTGNYTVNLSITMLDTNYASLVTAGSTISAQGNFKGISGVPTTTSFNVGVRNTADSSNVDSDYIHAAVFGGL